jgi:hypothetical protein
MTPGPSAVSVAAAAGAGAAGSLPPPHATPDNIAIEAQIPSERSRSDMDEIITARGEGPACWPRDAGTVVLVQQ